MKAYAKKTLLAQKATNCVSEIMFEESLAIPPVANWGPGIDSMNDSNSERSLLGVPISIKGIEKSYMLTYFFTNRLQSRHGRHQRL